MKQIVTMIICLLILIIGGVSEIKYLEKSASYITYDMEYIKNAIENGNYKMAKDQMNVTYEIWSSTKNIWDMFIIHDEIDDIDDAMIELKEYISFENEEECMVAIEKISNCLNHTVKRQKLNFDNIL